MEGEDDWKMLWVGALGMCESRGQIPRSFVIKSEKLKLDTSLECELITRTNYKSTSII